MLGSYQVFGLLLYTVRIWLITNLLGFSAHKHTLEPKKKEIQHKTTVTVTRFRRVHSFYLYILKVLGEISCV